MNDYDILLLIDQNIREQIHHELSLLSEEEKDLYDIKSRYAELYDLAEQDYIDDIADELAVQKYPRECVDNQEEYDRNIENELDDIYHANSKLQLNDPNKW